MDGGFHSYWYQLLDFFKVHLDQIKNDSPNILFLLLPVLSFTFLLLSKPHRSKADKGMPWMWLTACLSLWVYAGPTVSWSSYSCEPTMAMKTFSFGRCMWIKPCMLPASEGLLRVKCWLLAISHPTRLLRALTLHQTLTWCQSYRSSNLCIHYTRPGRVI